MSEIKDKATRAQKAALFLASLSTTTKNKALQSICKEIINKSPQILEANQSDLELAQESGVSAALQDRIRLNNERIRAIADGLRIIWELPDPIGETINSWTKQNGLTISKVRVPLGVIAIIYEARPNVTVDASTLCFKAGNSVILRGSSNTIFSNRTLVEIIRATLAAIDISPDAVQLIEDTRRESISELLHAKGLVDVIIPRGGASLIDFVVNNSTIPVLETGAGNCHIFIDADADTAQAIAITINAKTQRPSVCNAVETVLVHKEWAKNHLAKIVKSLVKHNVECRGCEESRKLAPEITPASQSDWSSEYLDLIIAIKIVNDVNEAIEHINRYGTRHSEAIISNNTDNVEVFFKQVDAAALYHNASTRFTDGFEFGFGAEIGICTQKLHARGPMGLPELTTYKYLVEGTGQTR